MISLNLYKFHVLKERLQISLKFQKFFFARSNAVWVSAFHWDDIKNCDPLSPQKQYLSFSNTAEILLPACRRLLFPLSIKQGLDMTCGLRITYTKTTLDSKTERNGKRTSKKNSPGFHIASSPYQAQYLEQMCTIRPNIQQWSTLKCFNLSPFLADDIISVSVL